MYTQSPHHDKNSRKGHNSQYRLLEDEIKEQILNESIRLSSSCRGFSSAFNLEVTGGSGFGTSFVGVLDGSVSWSPDSSSSLSTVFLGGVEGTGGVTAAAAAAAVISI